MNWDFELPVKIRFGRGRAAEAVELTRDMGEGMLICDRFLADSAALRLAELSQGRIRRIYSDVSPNPTVEEVDRCCAVIKSLGCRYIIAMGGGSVMDLAKAASVMAFGDVGAAEYHTRGKPLPENNIPVFAVPTTAGTGSEVTCVSVLTGAAGKAPLAHPRFYADTAIIDPELTISVPPGVTAATGLDVLSHALEGYWSRNHQPICDAAAMHAARLVFLNLPAAYQNPRDIDAREKMCEASPYRRDRVLPAQDDGQPCVLVPADRHLRDAARRGLRVYAGFVHPDQRGRAAAYAGPVLRL